MMLMRLSCNTQVFVKHFVMKPLCICVCTKKEVADMVEDCVMNRLEEKCEACLLHSDCDMENSGRLVFVCEVKDYGNG